MNHWSKFLNLFVALILLIGMVGVGLTPGANQVDNVQPALVQLAAESPEQEVRVIVQQAGDADDGQRLVEELGGTFVRELPFIKAFVAKLPAQDVTRLAQSEAVSWVSLDAPVVTTGKPDKGTTATFTVRDNFDNQFFENNDGLASWTTPWIENDVAGAGPTSGNVYIEGQTKYLVYSDLADSGSYYAFSIDGELFLKDSPDTGNQPSIERELDLSDGVTEATLSLYFRVGPGATAYEDSVVLEISTDGGATYSTLATFNKYNGGTTGTLYTNVLPYAAAQTRLRFRVDSGYSGPDEYFAVDNLQIEYVGNALPNITYLDTLNVREAWDLGYTGAGIGVAVVDSGVSTDRDFSSLSKISFNPNSNTVNDVYGHGTHVAGIIGGNGTDSGGQYKGIAPGVHLLGLKISDETGMAYESDTVDALHWIFEHKDQYNIRVVNLSIQSTVMQSYNDSPLNAAAEILWLNGIVVVAASGNWEGSEYFPVYAAPANDPFIITVGATDEKGTTRIRDDAIASFSAEGETQDFFLKPEIYAPGKDIISVLSKDSSWDVEHPDRVVFSGQFFRISGTSMAAPMVSGAAALLLQAEPNLTPDQVKYRLMNAAESVSNNPYLNVYEALTTPTTESANQGIVPHQLLAKMALIAYWSSQNGEETIDWASVDWDAVNWDAVDWDAVNWNAVNWNAVNWNAVNWNAVNWNAVNWNAVNWNAVNWNAVNWNAVNWNAVNWNAVNWDAAIKWTAVNWN
jgi:serine protease AprX